MRACPAGLPVKAHAPAREPGFHHPASAAAPSGHRDGACEASVAPPLRTERHHTVIIALLAFAAVQQAILADDIPVLCLDSQAHAKPIEDRSGKPVKNVTYGTLTSAFNQARGFEGRFFIIDGNEGSLIFLGADKNDLMTCVAALERDGLRLRAMSIELRTDITSC